METLSDNRLGYGKVMKDMTEADYNFFGPKAHQFAEGFMYKEEAVKLFIKQMKEIKCPIKPDCMAHKYRVQGFKMALLELNHNINKYAGDALCTKDEAEIDCDCHMQIGGSGEACPDCKKNGCGFCTLDEGGSE